MNPERAERLFEAGLALSSQLSLETILQRIVELAVEITGARYGALGVLGDDGRIGEFITEGVTPDERAAIGDPPTGHGILGVLLAEARPLRIPDVTQDPRSYGFPRNHPEMQSFLGAPVVARGRVFGNIYLTKTRGAEEFGDEDERALVVLASQAGVAIENARLYEQMRRRERWLDAARSISMAILSGASAQEALGMVASAARELVSADLATVAIPDPMVGHLTIQVADGFAADQLTGTTFLLDRSISGEVIRSGETVIVDDVSNDPQTAQPVAQMGTIGPAVFVPLSARGVAFGTLAAANRIGGARFDEEDRRLLETFAAQAAIALEYARAQQDAQRLVVLEERERIAKELHDGVIQSLFAVGMGLEATSALTDDPELARRIESASNEIDRSIRDLRNYIFGLRPGILADRELHQALKALCEELERGTGVVAVADIDQDVAAELSSRASDVVQLAREALSNVGKHSGASTCRLSLHRSGGGTALLEIDDDGKGFDVTAPTQGMGLGNLRDRVASLGGSLDIESTSGDGTRVRALIPI